MKRRRALFRACAATITVTIGVTACGGGGGSSPAPLPPAPAPTPSPTPPPIPVSAFAASRITLAAQVPQSCGGGPTCISGADAFIDASGELTAIWIEATAANRRLMAATTLPGAQATATAGVIEQNFTTNPTTAASLHQVGPRRFAVVDQADSTTNARARVFDTFPTSSPSAMPVVVLPAAFQNQSQLLLPNLFQDGARKLYALVPGQSAPFPTVDIGGGVQMTAVTLQPLPFAQVESSLISEFPQSIDPRLFMAVQGRELPSDSRQMYWTNARLETGVVMPPFLVSQQTFQVSNSQIACDTSFAMAAQTTGPGNFVLAWRQVNAAGSGCDLNVLGSRVNDGTNHVERFVVTGEGSEVIVVWQETSSGNVPRTFWSRRDPITLAWSSPVRIGTATAANEDGQELLFAAVGPSGSVAVFWQAKLRLSATATAIGETSVSKYVGQNWTTSATGTLPAVDAIAMNAAGQGVILSRTAVACTSSVGPCLELYAFRF
jgi:hypothetical protein